MNDLLYSLGFLHFMCVAAKWLIVSLTVIKYCLDDWNFSPN